ncbi:MAG: 16S rRNA processing protein RimM [Nitrospina sp.]|jgi:16S rRNA processing protein RimM|nr:16S rRNA processing protein RimM [Nitrospina sp.]MBT5652926.1 16S rRNA processing protein RimM [Nitrospina sp.]
MDWIPVGKLGRTHGLKGELKFYPQDPDDFDFFDGQTVMLEGTDKKLKVQSMRGANAPFIIKLEGVDQIESAKLLTGKEVLANREDFQSLPEGEYYRFEIEGLKVFDEEGRPYGIIEEIIPTGSNDVYVVRNGDKEWMLPMIDLVVKSIDLEQGKLVFHRIEGLLEDTPV